jgi:hypothetical protein
MSSEQSIEQELLDTQDVSMSQPDVVQPITTESVETTEAVQPEPTTTDDHPSPLSPVPSDHEDSDGVVQRVGFIREEDFASTRPVSTKPLSSSAAKKAKNTAEEAILHQRLIAFLSKTPRDTRIALDDRSSQELREIATLLGRKAFGEEDEEKKTTSPPPLKRQRMTLTAEQQQQQQQQQQQPADDDIVLAKRFSSTRDYIDVHIRFGLRMVSPTPAYSNPNHVLSQTFRRRYDCIYWDQIDVSKVMLNARTRGNKVNSRVHLSIDQKWQDKDTRHLFQIGPFLTVTFRNTYGRGSWKAGGIYPTPTYGESKMVVSLCDRAYHRNRKIEKAVRIERGEEVVEFDAAGERLNEDLDEDAVAFFEHLEVITAKFGEDHWNNTELTDMRRYIKTTILADEQKLREKTNKSLPKSEQDTSPIVIDEARVEEQFRQALRTAVSVVKDSTQYKQLNVSSYLLNFLRAEQKREFRALCEQSITQEMRSFCLNSEKPNEKGDVIQRVPNYPTLYRCATEAEVREARANNKLNSQWLPFIPIPHQDAEIRVGDVIAPIFIERIMALSPQKTHGLTHTAIGYIWLGESGSEMISKCEEALTHKSDLHPSTYFHMAQPYTRKPNWDQYVKDSEEVAKTKGNSTKGMNLNARSDDEGY